MFARTLAPLALGLMFLGPTSSAFADDDLEEWSGFVCCGASCCAIDGDCFGSGDMNPANACEVCDPSSSGSAWSAVPDCEPVETDAGPTPATDGGTDTGGRDDGGCSAGPSHAGTGGSLLLAAIGLIGFSRRRRR